MGLSTRFTALNKTERSRGQAARFSATWAVVLLGTFWAAAVVAQPRAYFQWGTPNGLGNQLSLARVPVQDATGAIKYYDVVLAFNVDSAGRMTLNSAATEITASPTVDTGAFKPGLYSNSGDKYDVGAPGFLPGGRASGSLTSHPRSAPLLNVSWVSGPIAGHPNEAALRAAGMTFEGYSWGIVGDVASCNGWCAAGWEAGQIVGVVQSGNQLMIRNFGNDSHEDRNAVFTLCSNPASSTCF